MADAEAMIYQIAELVYENSYVSLQGQWPRIYAAAEATGPEGFSWRMHNRCMSTARKIYDLTQTQ